MSSRRVIIPPAFHPNGVDTEVLTATFRLVALSSNGRKASSVLGYVDGRLIADETVISMDGQSADITLPINEDIVPTGTAYQVTLATEAKAYRYTGTVSTGSGDLLLANMLGWT